MMRKYSVRDADLFPELRLFESDSDRNDAWERVGRLVFLRRSYVAFVGLAFLTLIAIKEFVPSTSEVAKWSISIGGTLVLAFSMTEGWMWLRRRAIERVLRDLLRKKGIPICLHCGYCLRGSPTPHCPECGRSAASPDLPRDAI